jgi:hypothetical protein
MITWADYMVIQERNQDLRRQAEKERFIRQIMTNCQKGNQAAHPRKLQVISDDTLLLQLQKIIDLAELI